MKQLKNSTGVGQPQTFYLNQFGEMINGVFGSIPFLVGSATRSKKWRDVDVRLILTNKEWKTWGLMDSQKWAILCMAFSVLGKHITGLPIDFQIQRMAEANQRFKGKREALFWHYRKPA